MEKEILKYISSELYNYSEAVPAKLSAREISLVDSAMGEGFHHQLTKKIGSGYYNTVHLWGDGEGTAVVKVPKKNFYFGYPPTCQLELESEILQHYIPNMPQTYVVETKVENTAVTVAELINDFIPLTTGMLQNTATLRQQFQEYVQANEEMVAAEGLALDWMGWNATIKFFERYRAPLAEVKKRYGYIPDFELSENLVVTTDNTIRYLDSNGLWIRPRRNVEPKYIPAHFSSHIITTQFVINDVQKEILNK